MSTQSIIHKLKGAKKTKLFFGSIFFFFVSVYFYFSTIENARNNFKYQLQIISTAQKSYLNVTTTYGGGYRGGIRKVWGLIDNFEDSTEYEIDIVSNGFLGKEWNKIQQGDKIPVWFNQSQKVVIPRYYESKNKNAAYLLEINNRNIERSKSVFLFICILQIIFFILFTSEDNCKIFNIKNEKDNPNMPIKR